MNTIFQEGALQRTNRNRGTDVIVVLRGRMLHVKLPTDTRPEAESAEAKTGCVSTVRVAVSAIDTRPFVKHTHEKQNVRIPILVPNSFKYPNQIDVLSSQEDIVKVNATYLLVRVPSGSHLYS